jgi:hypothetical protein
MNLGPLLPSRKAAGDHGPLVVDESMGGHRVCVGQSPAKSGPSTETHEFPVSGPSQLDVVMPD